MPRRYPTAFFVIPLLLQTVASFAIPIRDVPSLVAGRNEEVLAAGKDSEAAGEGVWAARGRYFPTIKLRGTYLHLGNDIQLQLPSQTVPVGTLGTFTINPPPIEIQRRDLFLSNVNLMWPIFTGGRISAGVDAAIAQRDEARAMQGKVTQEKIAEALIRFFNVQLAREITTVLGRMKEDIGRIRGISESLVRSGLGAKFSILQIKVAEADLASRISEATGKAQLADLAFKTTVGKDSLSTVTYDTPLKKIPFNAGMEAYKTQALQKRKEFVVLKAKEEQVSALKAVHTGEMLPSVALVGIHRIWSSSAPILEPTWAVGAVMEIPLTSWLSSLPERERAVKLQEKVEILTARAKQEIPLQIEKLYAEAQATDAAYAALEESLAMAKEALRLAEVRFRNGDGASLEILRASSDLEKTEIHRLQLAEEFTRKMIELYQASGDVTQFIAAYETAPTPVPPPEFPQK